MITPWLTIVGIGEDGLYGLSPAARAALAGAEIVFGGARHLDLAGPAIHGEQIAWTTPFTNSIEAVLAARGRKVCVLASGDPFNYGVGATLSRHVDPAQLPSPGEILAAMTQNAVGGEGYDKAWPERAKATMW